MKLNRLLLLAALMGSSGVCCAHKDRIIQFSSGGTMEAIPAEFGPAQLGVVFAAPGSTQPIAGVTLRLGGHVTALPSCIVAQLPSRRMAQVSATASWYHNESRTLPYYLGIEFAAPEADPAGVRAAPVAILFNLRTAKIISVNGIAAGTDGSERDPGMGRSPRCTVQELDAVVDWAARLNAQ